MCVFICSNKYMCPHTFPYIYMCVCVCVCKSYSVLL